MPRNKREQLAGPAGAGAPALAQRGVPRETIQQLGLGFAPRRATLQSRLLGQGLSQSVLLQAA
jgi:hypothetical protein